MLESMQSVIDSLPARKAYFCILEAGPNSQRT